MGKNEMEWTVKQWVNYSRVEKPRLGWKGMVWCGNNWPKKKEIEWAGVKRNEQSKRIGEGGTE